MSNIAQIGQIWKWKRISWQLFRKNRSLFCFLIQFNFNGVKEMSQQSNFVKKWIKKRQLFSLSLNWLVHGSTRTSAVWKAFMSVACCTTANDSSSNNVNWSNYSRLDKLAENRPKMLMKCKHAETAITHRHTLASRLCAFPCGSLICALISHQTLINIQKGALAACCLSTSLSNGAQMLLNSRYVFRQLVVVVVLCFVLSLSAPQQMCVDVCV